MAKSRKKKIRTVTVDGVDYKWLVETRKELYTNAVYGIHLKIWDEDQELIFDDNLGRQYGKPRDVTPGLVVKLIKTIDIF